jgi:hypothetical protein
MQQTEWELTPGSYKYKRTDYRGLLFWAICQWGFWQYGWSLAVLPDLQGKRSAAQRCDFENLLW